MKIVPLRPDADGQHVIGEVRRLAPRRSERDVKPDFRLIGERLDP